MMCSFLPEIPGKVDYSGEYFYLSRWFWSRHIYDQLNLWRLWSYPLSADDLTEIVDFYSREVGLVNVKLHSNFS